MRTCNKKTFLTYNFCAFQTWKVGIVVDKLQTFVKTDLHRCLFVKQGIIYYSKVKFEIQFRLKFISF